MSRLIDQGPYRTPEEPPRPTVKYEWYFKKAEGVSESLNQSMLFGSIATYAILWALVASVCLIAGEPAAPAVPFLLRALLPLMALAGLYAALYRRKKPIE